MPVLRRSGPGFLDRRKDLRLLNISLFFRALRPSCRLPQHPHDNIEHKHQDDHQENYDRGKRHGRSSLLGLPGGASSVLAMASRMEVSACTFFIR